MSSRWAIRCVALFAGLMVAPRLTVGQTSGSAPTAASESRHVARVVLLGAGATWSQRSQGSGPVYHDNVHPGAMLEIEAKLSQQVAFGFFTDVTGIDDVDGHAHRLLTGLDLKLLPIPRGIVRPWVTAGVVASFLDDTGGGYGAGAGTFIVPDLPAAFFVDVRAYHVGNWEGSKVAQVMLRMGVAFGVASGPKQQ